MEAAAMSIATSTQTIWAPHNRFTIEHRADLCLTGWQYGVGRRYPYEDNMFESDWRGHSLDATEQIPAGGMVNRSTVPLQQHSPRA
jgi:hypothetical protein